MPPLTRLRIGVLDSLADQLRFTPQRTTLAQLERVERLAREIDPQRNYPEDWVVFRLTGHRASIESPALFVGAALLAELSAFSERISDEAGLGAGDVPKGALTLDELRERWGVDRKTIERYRRKGLIARRASEGGAASRLVFSKSAVESFEARTKGALARAQGFDRIATEESRRIVAQAKTLRSEQGLTLNEAARRLAQDHGRAHETIRRLLASAQRREAAPIFTERGPVDSRERRVIRRAWRAGVPVASIARRFERTPASVRRLVAQRRGEFLRALDLPPAAGPAHQIDDSALAPELVRMRLGAPGERTLAAFLAAASEQPSPPSAGEERTLAAAHAALLARAAAAIAALPKAHPSVRVLDHVETDLRWAALLRCELVRRQMRIIKGAIEETLACALEEAPPRTAQFAVERALSAACAAAAGFDPHRGGRLAARTTIAVHRALAPTPTSQPHASAPPPPPAGPNRPGRARAAPQAVALRRDWTAHAAPWRPWLDPDPRIYRRLGEFDKETAAALSARFGWDVSPPTTLEELARRTGWSRRRVASLETDALRSLRERSG